MIIAIVVTVLVFHRHILHLVESVLDWYRYKNSLQVSLAMQNRSNTSSYEMAICLSSQFEESMEAKVRYFDVVVNGNGAAHNLKVKVDEEVLRLENAIPGFSYNDKFALTLASWSDSNDNFTTISVLDVIYPKQYDPRYPAVIAMRQLVIDRNKRSFMIKKDSSFIFEDLSVGKLGKVWVRRRDAASIELLICSGDDESVLVIDPNSGYYKDYKK